MPKKIRKNHRVEVVTHGYVGGMDARQVAFDVEEELRRLFREHASLNHLEAYHRWDTEEVCALCEKPYELFEGACAWCGGKEKP